MYDSILKEREDESRFQSWRRKVRDYNRLYKGTGMPYVRARFQPWKSPGFSYKERYRMFLKYYKLYYLAKKVVRVGLEDAIFKKGLEGEALTHAFADILASFNVSSCGNSEYSVDDGVSHELGDSAKVTECVTEADGGEAIGDMSVSEDGSNDSEVEQDNVSYASSDDAYDVNMYPGYGRQQNWRDTSPSFTYTKTT